MIFSIDDDLDCFIDDLLEIEYKMEGSLELLRESNCGDWLLIAQSATKEEKWVSAKSLIDDGALIAFYDADPTYLPVSEKRN